jgi:hypothetical protein
MVANVARRRDLLAPNVLFELNEVPTGPAVRQARSSLYRGP